MIVSSTASDSDVIYIPAHFPDMEDHIRALMDNPAYQDKKLINDWVGLSMMYRFRSNPNPVEALQTFEQIASRNAAKEIVDATTDLVLAESRFTGFCMAVDGARGQSNVADSTIKTNTLDLKMANNRLNGQLHIYRNVRSDTDPDSLALAKRSAGEAEQAHDEYKILLKRPHDFGSLRRKKLRDIANHYTELRAAVHDLMRINLALYMIGYDMDPTLKDSTYPGKFPAGFSAAIQSWEVFFIAGDFVERDLQGYRTPAPNDKIILYVNRPS